MFTEYTNPPIEFSWKFNERVEKFSLLLSRLTPRDYGEAFQILRDREKAELEKQKEEWKLPEEFYRERLKAICETNRHVMDYLSLTTRGDATDILAWLIVRKHQPEIKLSEIAENWPHELCAAIVLKAEGVEIPEEEQPQDGGDDKKKEKRTKAPTSRT